GNVTVQLENLVGFYFDQPRENRGASSAELGHDTALRVPRQLDVVEGRRIAESGCDCQRLKGLGGANVVGPSHDEQRTPLAIPATVAHVGPDNSSTTQLGTWLGQRVLLGLEGIGRFVKPALRRTALLHELLELRA